VGATREQWTSRGHSWGERVGFVRSRHWHREWKASDIEYSGNATAQPRAVESRRILLK
jgi:hypothetical protein